MAAVRKLYKIVFLTQGKVYELYAKRIHSSELYGFVQVSDLIFDAQSSLLVDPSEERLRDEFAKTRHLHLPMHSVIRVEEVEERGIAVIRDAQTGEKIMPFPLSVPRKD